MSDEKKDRVNPCPLDENVISFDTFHAFSEYQIRDMQQNEPSVFNRIVSVRKYRVTIEPIAEFDDTIKERLQKMLSETSNMHHREAIREEAKRYGFKLL